MGGRSGTKKQNKGMNLSFIKNIIFILLLSSVQLSFSQAKSNHTNGRYIFFLHNKFIEDHNLDEQHPQYGNVHYNEILNELKKSADDKFNIQIDTLIFLDKSRNREIPVAVYQPQAGKKIIPQQIIIFSHGYFMNEPYSNMRYSYLTEYLASKGYIVISIQHELTDDELIPNVGIPQVVRRPFWERGTDNILFVINEFKKMHTEWDFGHITLMGHSNGADMTALFQQKYPGIVNKIITLDNRRMALPRTKNPKIYSLRSSDQPADDGVLPTRKEQKKYGITIVKLHNTIHNNMDDSANEEQRREIRNYVMTFLED